MHRFAQKTAIVTGGASGIGLEIEEQLAREGASVAIADVNPRLEAAVNRLTSTGADAIGVTGDIADEQQVQNLIDTGARREPDRRAPVGKAAARVMLGLGTNGAIVNIGSVDAHAAERNDVAYNVSKAGLLALTRTFAVELGSVGIRANSVSPGYVLTPTTLAGAANDPAVEALPLSETFDRVPCAERYE